MMTKILWVERKNSPAPSFLPALRNKGYHVKAVQTGKAALAHLDSQMSDLAVVNAASMRSSGQRICRALRVSLNEKPILLIRHKAQPFLKETEANRVLVLPFTIRKLLNRIRSLVPESDAHVITAGPLTLNLHCNTLALGDSMPQHLTPNLTALMKVLIEHPGEVVPRDSLFREIWQTDYIEDMRTLDVHISWLRKKMGNGHPGLLKTIRGVGYRLDV